MYRGCGLGICVLVAAFSCAVRAEGAAIILTGDLGRIRGAGRFLLR